MDRPKKIVLVIGNGFDLDLGLKTSYRDFWESDYCPKDYPSPLIRHLNSNWCDDLKSVRWYDLENELHTFALSGDRDSDIVSEDEIRYLRKSSSFDIHKDVNFQLLCSPLISLLEKGLIHNNDSHKGLVAIPYHQDYNYSVEWRNRKSLNLIKEGLCNYLKSVEFAYGDNRSRRVSYIMLQALSNMQEDGVSLEIFSFNYTHFPDFGIRIDKPVNYMHGSCQTGKIIIGAKDDLAIDTDYDFLQKAMDPAFKPPGLVRSLQEAGEVILFGHSLGENDKQYFTSFFRNAVSFDNQQSKDITIFTFDQTAEDDIKRSLNKMTDGNLSVLFSNNNLEFIKTASIEEDQHILLDFLIRHKTERRYASELVGRLLGNR